MFVSRFDADHEEIVIFAVKLAPTASAFSRKPISAICTKSGPLFCKAQNKQSITTAIGANNTLQGLLPCQACCNL